MSGLPPLVYDVPLLLHEPLAEKPTFPPLPRPRLPPRPSLQKIVKGLKSCLHHRRTRGLTLAQGNVLRSH